jgi:hypothetical protein
MSPPTDTRPAPRIGSLPELRPIGWRWEVFRSSEDGLARRVYQVVAHIPTDCGLYAEVIDLVSLDAALDAAQAPSSKLLSSKVQAL